MGLNMTCQDSRCKCTIELYPLEANRICESKGSYVTEHNLTSYKVMPGVYCYFDYDCITGLDWHDVTSACPHPCTFDNKTSACDCGDVSVLEGTSPAILVGVFGGLIIVYFWAYMIKKTMNGQPKQNINSHYDQAPHSDPKTSFPEWTMCTSPDANSTHSPGLVSNQAPSDAMAPVGFPVPSPTATPPAPIQQPPPYGITSSPYSKNHRSPSSGYSTNPVVGILSGNPINPSSIQTSTYSKIPGALVDTSNDTPHQLIPSPCAAPGYSSDKALAQSPGTVLPAYRSSGTSTASAYPATSDTDTSPPPAKQVT
ncbi:unnamed protein product [Meganyctiphanes norvegica]|uniref:Uncharacterized protein n=1 Tax=Meganyctiphanes norvegica TaxID=48144 RepID=A0AAV2SKV1_MEGNR